MSASLKIEDVPEHICGNLVCAARWDVTVDAFVRLEPGENPDLTNHKVAIRLWGEDPVSDDLLSGPVYVSPALPDKPPNPRCGYFYRDGGFLKIRGCVGKPKTFLNLNEDWGEDEIYAGVRVLNPAGATLRSAETNRITGSY
jgi:hypothetical protein